MKNKKPIEILLENAQLGDKVVYNKQRGYVIGETSDGNLIIQIQGSTKTAKPKDVKVLRGHVNISAKSKQFKFDKQTQKVLFEQYVKAGIYMGRTPIKLNNTYVKYSDYLKENEELEIISDGEPEIYPRENIKLLDSPDEFANPADYVEGVVIEEDGTAIQSVLVNALDYTNAIGDSDMVRIILLDENKDPFKLDTIAKGSVKTLSV